MQQFELVGVRAGSTVDLGGYPFVSGVYSHDTGEDVSQTGLPTFLARCYDAHPIGSQALEDAKVAFAESQLTGIAKVMAPRAPRAAQMSLTDAITALDPKDDDDWTAAGLPSVDEISELTGTRVTRASVETAAPGFTRASAVAAAI